MNKKYIYSDLIEQKHIKTMFLDTSLLVNPEKFEGIEKDITCPICQGIINDPYFCNKCQNNFCKKCINKWNYNNSKCPFRCPNPQYVENKFLVRIFSELLKFKCQKGCEKIISYKDIPTHFENCKNENFKEKYFECATKVEILKVQLENYNDIENELNETKNELEQANERNTELENELEEIKEEKGDWENRIDELNENIENLECQLNGYNKLKNDYNNIFEQKNELENKLNEEIQKNKDLKNEINEYKKQEKDKEKEKNYYEKQIKELKDIITKLNSEKNDLFNELSCLKLGIVVEKDEKI